MDCIILALLPYLLVYWVAVVACAIAFRRHIKKLHRYERVSLAATALFFSFLLATALSRLLMSRCV